MLLRIRYVKVVVDHIEVISLRPTTHELRGLRRGQDRASPNIPDTKKDLGVDYRITLARPKYVRHVRTDPKRGAYLIMQGRSLFERAFWVELRRLKDENIRITGIGNIRVDKMYHPAMVPAKPPLEAAQQTLLHLDRAFPKTLSRRLGDYLQYPPIH